MTFQTSPLSTWQPWAYRDDSWLSSSYDLTGYAIAATDGELGKVDEASYETDGSYLVVATGPWVFGKKVMLPAGVVSSIDHQNRAVVVDRTKDQIREAPEFNESMMDDPAYRDALSAYYDAKPENPAPSESTF